MNTNMAKGKKKNFIFKKFDRWLTMYTGQANPSNVDALPKSKSCNGCSATRVAPGGCFSVYVGPEQRRFVIKAKCANHPMFKMLLEDAEDEYGYKSDGPIMLPCDVDLFYKVLAEIESGKEIYPAGCSPFRAKSNSYALLTPSRLLKMNNNF